MSKTWRLRMEVFFRTDDRVSHRTIFQGTDGGSFTHTRCGGRLPSIWTSSIAPPIRLGFYLNTFDLFIFFISFQNSLRNHRRFLICSCVNADSNHCQHGPEIPFNKWFGIFYIYVSFYESKTITLVLNMSEYYIITQGSY